MKVLLAGKQIRCRQAHERQPRTICPAANEPRSGLDAGATQGFSRVLGDLRHLVEHAPHVAVLLFDLDRDVGARHLRGRHSRQRLDERFLLHEPGGDEVANDQPDRRLIDGRPHA